MLGLPIVSSPASRPSFEGTKEFAAARTRLTPQASILACRNINPDQEPEGWPQAPFFDTINNYEQKTEGGKGCEDE